MGDQGDAKMELLAGLVERVTFHSPESGFCVLRVKARGHRDLVTVVGHAAMISAGEWVTASGEWTNDRTHGQQFRARFLKTSAPSSIEGIEKYLGSGHDPRHRTGLRQAHGQAFRQGRLRHHRGQPRAAARGRRHRPDARGQDHRRPGPTRRSSARSWCSCTSTASAPRGRCASSRPMAPTPCR